jgi:hypothetical protein
VLVERAALVAMPRPVPGDPIPRQLGGRQQAETLVVGLEQGPLLVQQAVGHLPAIPLHPGEEHEVVVAPGDLERIELERPEAVDHPHDAFRAGRQRPRRREQVAVDEEPAGGGRGEAVGSARHRERRGDGTAAW